MRVSFIVPAHNEAATIEEVLERVHELPFEKQVIVVDNGSTDAPGDILARWEEQRGVIALRQQQRGKGSAIRAGLAGGRPQRAYLFWHLVGNRFLSLLANVLYNTTLTDIETGYKAFRPGMCQTAAADANQNAARWTPPLRAGRARFPVWPGRKSQPHPLTGLLR